MSNQGYYEIFRDLLSNKIIQTKDSRKLLDVVRAAEEALPHIPGEEDQKQGFAYSYSNYQDAVEDCRKLKNKKFRHAERVEMMIGVRELPYPFTCIIETSASKMQSLDNELSSMHQQLNLKDDELGIRNISQLIFEKQSILRRETWETDPPLMGFKSW